MKIFMDTYGAMSFTNDKRDRMLFLTDILSISETLASGVLKKGHSGQETDIDEIDEDNKPTTVGNVKHNQFNSLYFYFLLCLPKSDSDYMIFMAQSFKQFGFKDLFTASYKDYCKSKLGEEYSVEISPLTIPSLFSKYLNQGDIRSLRFTNHNLPQNFENLIGEGDSPDPTDYEVDFVVRAKSRKGFKGIKNYDFQRTPFTEVFDLDIEYQNAYADISINNRKRSINITNPDKFTAVFDVTSQVRYEENSLKPIYTDLDTEAKKILSEEILRNI